MNHEKAGPDIIGADLTYDTRGDSDMNQHTPGPWTIERHETMPDGYYITCPARGNATICAFQTPYGAFVNTHCNVHLIASAPDLLATLKLYRKARETGDYTGADEAAVEALAKAQPSGKEDR